MTDTPFLRVIRGDASAEEIAALITALSGAAMAAPARAGRRPRPVWSDRAALVRQPFGHGPDAWRRNARRGIV
jgi:acyl-CoA carboxylase epsilon subunit